MAKAEIAIRDGWFPRLLRALKLVQVEDDGTTTHIAGSDFVSPQAASRSYKALDSMSAMAAFPWVRACVDAISSDLTKLPIKAVKGRGKDAEPIDEHPLLDLLDRPSSRISGILFRRQLIVDLSLTGDAFVLAVGSPEPQALLRLHPERVRVIPSSDGQPLEYEYDGAGQTARYGFEQVLHIRMPSWSDTTSGLYGSGAIQALNNDLHTDLAASKLAAESAKTGLPTGIISPSEEGDRWSKAQITQLREGFTKQLNSKSGTVILGAGVDYRQLSQTLRDMEYKETRLMAREAVLAAFSVPPSRVGLPNANYATAMAQSRLYWEGLSGTAALIDSELTRLARMFPDSDGVRIFHDFSEVEALQESRTERVNRVQAWWLMGVSLSEAAALEGFDNLDASEIDETAEPEPEPEAADEELAKWLVIDGDQAKAVDYETEEGRAAVWRGFIDRVQGPAERKMALTMRRYLRGQASRISKRLKKELGTKGVTKAIDNAALDRILDEMGESKLLVQRFKPLYRDALRRAFDDASRSIKVSQTMDPKQLEREALEEVRRMKTSILQTTNNKLRAAIDKGLAEDYTLAELQQAVINNSAFTPVRAMAIARTESTRMASVAGQRAYDMAEAGGVKLEKMWLTARDELVRDAHRHIEEKGWIPSAAPFTSGASTADGPGRFEDPGLDINCRCTTIARVVK